MHANNKDFEITIPRPTFGDHITVEVLGSNADDYVGQHQDLIIFDEYALCNPTFWYVNLSPMILKRKNPKVIFSGTPRGDNHFNEERKRIEKSDRGAVFVF